MTHGLVTLTRRADFLAAARAHRASTAAFTLQARKRAGGTDPETGSQDAAASVRVGYTCSKKVGNAVARNRAKRRLREAARAVLPTQGHAGWDYVLIGRRDLTATRPFSDLLQDLRRAVERVHAPRPGK